MYHDEVAHEKGFVDLDRGAKYDQEVWDAFLSSYFFAGFGPKMACAVGLNCL